MSGAELIAVDWGTTRFRAFLVNRDSGEVLDSQRSDAGLSALGSAEFPHYCAAQLAPWRQGAHPPAVYLAGMVGAARGWHQAPQLELPVTAAMLAEQLVAAPGMDNAWIVPGVRVVRDDHVDVMRGEEIQAFGALAIDGSEEALCCLPGTHSKWARLERGQLVDFVTAMTGELYHAVRFHTLPGEPARAADDYHEAAFEQGLATAAHPAGLLHALFEARSRHLHTGLADSQVGSFISGVMIGSEVRTQRQLYPDTERVLLVSGAPLSALYRSAMQRAGFSDIVEIDSDRATLAGITALAARHNR